MRLALVGCGYVADYYLRTIPRHPELRVIGAYDRAEERSLVITSAYGLRAYGSLDELLADPDVDIVLNLTNPADHAEVTRAALEAGKHVYSEKPLATSLDEAEVLADLATARGLQLSAAPCNVLGEAAQTAWAALRRHRVGTVRLVYAEMDDGMVHRMPYDRWLSASGIPWPARNEFEVGCTMEHAGYYLTWLAAFFGPARSVSAFAACLVPDKGLDPPVASAPDFTVACLTFDHGVVARLTCSIVAPFDRSLTVVGDDGVLEVKDCWDFGSPVRVKRSARIRRRTVWLPPMPVHPVRRQQRRRTAPELMDFARGVADLAEAIRLGRPPRLSAEFCLHITELTLAIQGALGGGSPHTLRTTFEPMKPMPWAHG